LPQHSLATHGGKSQRQPNGGAGGSGGCLAAGVLCGVGDGGGVCEGGGGVCDGEHCAHPLQASRPHSFGKPSVWVPQ